MHQQRFLPLDFAENLRVIGKFKHLWNMHKFSLNTTKDQVAFLHLNVILKLLRHT